MNFPDKQKTGRLGEMEVEYLFTSWSFTVGRDHIDTGYDLIVEPLIDQFHGHRFLVQVKATKIHSKSGGISAPVDKARLRQYAINPIPVFIVRKTADGKLYWIHAQEWAKNHPSYLVGNGRCNVKLPGDQLLNNQEKFTAYLCEIFKPMAERKSALVDLAADRNFYLSSIDPRLTVKVKLQNGAERYEISAKSDDVKLNFEVLPSNKENGNNILESAIRFGIPTEIQVDTLKISGTKLFDELGLPSHLGGSLSIQAIPTHEGVLSIRAGATYSILATSWAFPALMYRGHDGIAIRAKDANPVLRLEIRSEYRGATNVNLEINEDRLCIEPIRDLTDLEHIGEWAWETLQENAVRLEVSFKGMKAPLVFENLKVDQIASFLSLAMWLGRLHKVAKALNSELILERNLNLSQGDTDTILFAYWLLKGERREININSFVVNGVESFSNIESTDTLFLRTELVMTIDNKRLGVVPVIARLHGYSFESLPEVGSYRVIKGNEGKAVMHFDDNRVDAELKIKNNH